MFTIDALYNPTPAELVRCRKRLYLLGLCTRDELLAAASAYIESKRAQGIRIKMTPQQVITRSAALH